MENSTMIAAVKPFRCHGQRNTGQACTASLTQAEAWLPTLAAIRHATGRMPSAVSDLKDHTHCGRCAALGRKAGLRFYHYPATVQEMEKRRVERVQTARQAFGRYLPKDTKPNVSSAVGATPTALAEAG